MWVEDLKSCLQTMTGQRIRNLFAIGIRSWYTCYRLIGVGRDSSVGKRLATAWTGRGSDPGGGRIFPTRTDRPLGPYQPPIQWVPGLLPGSKAAEAWR
jgi:hypothetical protein